MSEVEPKPTPTITVPTLDDIEGYRRVQAQGWIDVYPNEEAGVSKEWVEGQALGWLTQEALEESKEYVQAKLDDPNFFIFIAKADGKCVGMVSATKKPGAQTLDAIYIDKEYHGTGLADRMFDKAMGVLDVTQPTRLEVVAYNKRAISFYEKHGFRVIPGSEFKYKDVMPSVVMEKPGESSEV